MKPSILLFAATALAAPVFAQSEGPGTGLIELFEKSQRDGATEEQLLKMLENEALMELQLPESREIKPAGEKELLEELLRKDAEQERFRPLLEDGKQRKQARAKDGASPRGMMEEGPALQPSRWIVGLTVKPLDPALRLHFDLPEGNGVLVESLLQGGPAVMAGIKPNDILVTANGRKVSTLEGLKEVVEKAGNDGKAVNLEVIHRGSRKVVKVAPRGPETLVGPSKKEAQVPAKPKRPMIEIQRRLDQQQREIEAMRREVQQLQDRITRE